jgi:prepilin-type N-terminal cleavage/methylation domain-containing protein
VRRPKGAHGFTLLEILVVVGLMGLLMTVFMPRLGGLLRFEIRGAARALAAELEYTSERSIASRTLHRWVLDLDSQVFRVERLNDAPLTPGSDDVGDSELLDLRAPLRTYEFLPLDARTGEWRSLDQTGVQISQVLVGDTKSTAGTVAITFGPDGGADPAELLIVDDGDHKLRVTVTAFTSEIHVEESDGA